MRRLTARLRTLSLLFVSMRGKLCQPVKRYICDHAVSLLAGRWKETVSRPLWCSLTPVGMPMPYLWKQAWNLPAGPGVARAWDHASLCGRWHGDNSKGRR